MFLKKPFYIPIFFLLAVSTTVHSQQYTVKQYRGELNIKLSAIDDKRIDRGIAVLNEAAELEREALELFKSIDDSAKLSGKSSEYRKSIKGLLEASETYKEGHDILYTVFDENCVQFGAEMKKMNHYAAGMMKAKYYEKVGESHQKHTHSIRLIILEADKPEWIQYKMAEAFEVGKLAIRDKGRALQIYQDFPVEYNYGWEDDVTPEEVEAAFKNPVIKRPPDNLFVQTKVADDTIVSDTGIVIEAVIPVVFKVQIAAHINPMSDDYMRNIYSGREKIIESHEGMWYRYTIGHFFQYKDAQNLLKACRVRKAFIVAYQGSTKLTIKEALAIIQENQ